MPLECRDGTEARKGMPHDMGEGNGGDECQEITEDKMGGMSELGDWPFIRPWLMLKPEMKWRWSEMIQCWVICDRERWTERIESKDGGRKTWSWVDRIRWQQLVVVTTFTYDSWEIRQCCYLSDNQSCVSEALKTSRYK